ncbi:hypothetical protein HZC32_01625 [Candidatus Woesearchaeota archaeon]|nr:hypothetical protein [Candidatus Woesearchaeota archaeon]
MKAVITEDLLDVLSRVIAILETKDNQDPEELKKLSDHAIEDIAAHKDLDLVSISVLIYSIYKILLQLSPEDYADLLTELKNAEKQLEQNNLGRYNFSIKKLYEIVKKSDSQIKVHLQDVMQAARIKKSATLLHKGLSIGQAAGLMGLSNWDLQQYVGKTVYTEPSKETYPESKRLALALTFFVPKSSGKN